MNRRTFLWLPAMAQVPELPVQSGDVLGDRAIIWSRALRPGRMVVEWSTTDSFRNVRTVMGPFATPETGLTARVDLHGLPPDQSIFYRVRFDGGGAAAGKLKTAPRERRDVKFLWSGDTCGQGYGINPDFGGMKTYEAMRLTEPDFFLHSGDTIYADNPIPAQVGAWKNITTEAKSKVAETLDEFRGAYQYNLLDENVGRFNADVAQIWQWDDHEVMNNWSPGKDLRDDKRYREKDVRVLVERARQAFLEYAPMRGARIYRRNPYGPLLDVFVLDMRSFRAANNHNLQQVEGPETAYLGKPQIDWLLRDLARSKATWKVIAADMPLGLIVPDGRDAQGRPIFENSCNGDGPARGRELEIARVLRRIQRMRIRNVVWLTADVHYTAAHYFDPAKARFTEFDPFWEFVSGPLNAGTFGPGQLDNTFGPSVVYQKHPPKGQGNLPPSAGMQFFGEVLIQGKSGEMRVTLRDMAGTSLFEKVLEPV